MPRAARRPGTSWKNPVVSHVADDVKVSILGRTVEMTIVKKMA